MAILSDEVYIQYDVNPRLVTIRAPRVNISVQDLYDTIMYLTAQPDGIDEPEVITASGLEELGGGTRVGLTIKLIDAIIKFEDRETSTICSVDGGNTTSYNTSSEEYVYPLAFSTNINTNYTASSSATQADLEAIQYSSYQNAVWIDPSSSNEGTDFPSGTREYPVNNVIDAIDIANLKGFDTLQLLDSITLTDGMELENFQIVGRNATTVQVTIENGANTLGCEISECCVCGVLDGATTLQHCVTYDLHYINGFITNCILMGDLYLDGEEQATIVDCSCGEVTGYQTIDMGGDGQDCVFRNFNGNLIIKNMIDDGNYASLFFNSGKCIIDETISAGVVEVRGVTEVDDYSTGTAIVITDSGIGESTPAEKSAEYNGQVVIDFVSGYSGTLYPNGTNFQPSNNFIDAKAIAEDLHIKKFLITSDVVLDDDVSDYAIYGQNYEIFDMNAFDCDNNTFDKVTVTGVQKESTEINIKNSRFLDITDFNGNVEDCHLTGWLKLGNNGHSSLKNVTTKYYTNAIDFQNYPHDIFLNQFDGQITITNMNSPFVGGYPTSICNFVTNAVIIIDETCTMGYLRVGGNAVITNNSTSPYFILDNSRVLFGYSDIDKVGEAVWTVDPEDPKYSGNESNMGTFLHKTKVWINNLRNLLK